MGDKEFELLKRQFRFEQWAGRNRLPENLFVNGYLVSDRAVPDWQLVRKVELAVSGAPACTQSIWRREVAREALLRFDVYECSSRLEAHEFLVRFLAEVEAAEAARVGEGPHGDVGFSWLNDYAFLFARGNLVMFLSNAGHDRLPIADSAQQLDADLISKPTVRVRKEPSAQPRVVIEPAGGALTARTTARLRIETPPGPAGSSYQKIFSKAGEVVRGPEGLEFRAEGSGKAWVTVYTVSAEGALGRATQQFTIA